MTFQSFRKRVERRERRKDDNALVEISTQREYTRIWLFRYGILENEKIN